MSKPIANKTGPLKIRIKDKSGKPHTTEKEGSTGYNVTLTFTIDKDVENYKRFSNSKNKRNKETIMKTDYQKINTLFMRDENNIIMPSTMTCEEFEYLKNCQWECTEKIDGTNIHIDVNGVPRYGVSISPHGRTQSAEIPKHLMNKLCEIFTTENIQACFANNWEDVLSEKTSISIYGEGYGMKIKKGGNYMSKEVGFILFDVKVGEWWLKREACESIAKALSVPIVPLVGYMTIPEAIEYVRNGFKSTIAENKNYEAEGLVLKTMPGLKFRNGERIITKLKTVDFRKYRNKYGEGPVEQKLNSKYKEQ